VAIPHVGPKWVNTCTSGPTKHWPTQVYLSAFCTGTLFSDSVCHHTLGLKLRPEGTIDPCVWHCKVSQVASLTPSCNMVYLLLRVSWSAPVPFLMAQRTGLTVRRELGNLYKLLAGELAISTT
jgi:hypothetical protein